MNKCCICGLKIAPGQEDVDRITATQTAKWPIWSGGNKWIVRHEDCPAPVVETDFYEIRNMVGYDYALAAALEDAAKMRLENEKYFR